MMVKKVIIAEGSKAPMFDDTTDRSNLSKEKEPVRLVWRADKCRAMRRCI